MEISFKTQGEIQVIEIDGAIGDPEAAAVRVKLEQKINQGKLKVLFDLGSFPLENDAARRLLVGIVAYALNRGALAACCGVKSSHRPLFILPGNQQVKVLFTRTEGLDYLQKNVVTKTLSRIGGKNKTEEEIKEEALQKLFDRYEVFQHNDDDDPFRLQFLIEQYKVSANREALQIEKKAEESLLVLHEENQNFDRECDNLSKQVKALMQYRKTPLSGKELKSKQEELAEEIEEMSSAVGKLQQTIQENRSAVEKAKKQTQDAKQKSAEAIQSLEEHVKTTGETFAKEAQDLQKQDVEEQANLEAHLKK